MKYRLLPLVIASILLIAGNAQLQAQTCSVDYIQPTTPSAQFQRITATEVRDNKTGLIWQRCSLGQRGEQCQLGEPLLLDWISVQRRVESNIKSPAWRLPTPQELRTLIEEQCSDPSINLEIFPNSPSDIYWASEIDSQQEVIPWFVSFRLGYAGIQKQQSMLMVRLVRTEAEPSMRQ